MNIDGVKGSSFIQSYQNQMNVPKAGTAKPLQQEDQLHISSQAKQMFELEAAADKERMEKIQSLKAQVQAGEYKVNDMEVAERLFDFWFDRK